MKCFESFAQAVWMESDISIVFFLCLNLDAELARNATFLSLGGLCVTYDRSRIEESEKALSERL